MSNAGIIRKIEDLCQRYAELNQLHGAILVAHQKNILFQSAYGFANKEWQNENTALTKFRLGSATKHFTAILALIAIQEEKLQSSDCIAKFLPNYRKDVGSLVTVHQLLTHTSGIPFPNLSKDEYREFSQTPMDTSELISKYGSNDLQFKPGEKFQYSSAGYIILGAILEQVYNANYAEILKDKILKPLDMTDTGVDDYEEIIPFRASGYQRNYRYGNAMFKYMLNSHASGALYSTVGDLFKLYVGLFQQQLLTQENLDRMFQKHIPYGNRSYGYGCFVQDFTYNDEDFEYISHGGDVSGFSGAFTYEKSGKYFIAVLTNQECTNYNQIINNIRKILYGELFEEPRAVLADILRDKLFTTSLKETLTTFDGLKQTNFLNVDIEEAELNELGYDLLFCKRIPEAIEIFKITVQLYPHSANAYDSLGDAYAEEQFNLKKAIESYEKCLTIDPNVSETKEKLTKIQKELRD